MALLIRLRMTLMALLCVALVAGAANAQFRRNRKAPEPSHPSTRFLFSYKQIFDRQKLGDGDHFLNSMLRAGQIGYPPPPMLRKTLLHTIMVTGYTDGTTVLMNEELCKRDTSMLFRDTHRWGPIFYGHAPDEWNYILQNIKDLVDINCGPGIVETIQIGVYIQSEPPARVGQGNDGVYPYTGTIILGQTPHIVHDDPDGMQRYRHYNAGLERRSASMRERQATQARWRNSTVGSLGEYCNNFPNACAGFGLFAVLAVSGGEVRPGATPAATHHNICLSKCAYYPIELRTFCEASCVF